MLVGSLQSAGPADLPHVLSSTRAPLHHSGASVVDTKILMELKMRVTPSSKPHLI